MACILSPLRLRTAGALAGSMMILLAACGGPPAATAPEEAEAGAPPPIAAPAAEEPAPAETPAEPPTEADAAEEPADDPAAPAVTFDPEQVTLALEPVTEDLQSPLFATHAGDGSGRLFILEKPGRIRILRDGQLVETPFLDLTDRVLSSGNEQGLLGLAFDPAYAESGFFWVNYTGDDGRTVVSRFQASDPSAGQADPSTEFIVLEIPQPARNHNGGMITFGPDGYLWIGMGDGGGANDRFGNAQNPETLLGKMLRLDVTGDPDMPYAIPADNPWVNADWNGADVADEVWAVGLRNPWRFSFDRATNDLWIADVGQNQIEEVNWTPADQLGGGWNYGWPIMEGTHCFQQPECSTEGLVLPVAEYDHSGGHCSVTGGYVYRGEQFPAIQGVYFFADYCSGALWATAPDGSGGWATYPMLDTGISVSSFGEDEAGEMYLTDLNGGLYRLMVQ